MRHYEILANGCIPFFEDIENIPETTMKLFPKKQLILFYKTVDNLISNGEMNHPDIKNFIQFLLNYTNRYLTTTYTIIQLNGSLTIPLSNPKILFISGCEKICQT
jgi:hypothetical protein